jgi:hypothetical protein
MLSKSKLRSEEPALSEVKGIYAIRAKRRGFCDAIFAHWIAPLSLPQNPISTECVKSSVCHGQLAGGLSICLDFL